MAYSKHQTVPLKTLTGGSFAVFKAIWGLSAADPESVGTQDVDQLIHENQRRPTAAILSDIPQIHQLGVTSSLWSLVQCVCVCVKFQLVVGLDTQSYLKLRDEEAINVGHSGTVVRTILYRWYGLPTLFRDKSSSLVDAVTQVSMQKDKQKYLYAVSI